MYHDLTEGKISRSLLLFALPMMAGNLLQQFYNIANTLIVGRVLFFLSVTGTRKLYDSSGISGRQVRLETTTAFPLMETRSLPDQQEVCC